jgi:hypothetical protein
MASPGPTSFTRLLAIDGSPTKSPETEWTELNSRLTLSPTNRNLQRFLIQQAAIDRPIPTTATGGPRRIHRQLDSLPPAAALQKQKLQKNWPGRWYDAGQKSQFSFQPPIVSCARWAVDAQVAGTIDRASLRRAIHQRC